MATCLALGIAGIGFVERHTSEMGGLGACRAYFLEIVPSLTNFFILSLNAPAEFYLFTKESESCNLRYNLISFEKVKQGDSTIPLQRIGWSFRTSNDFLKDLFKSVNGFEI